MKIYSLLFCFAVIVVLARIMLFIYIYSLELLHYVHYLLSQVTIYFTVPFEIVIDKVHLKNYAHGLCF